MHGFYNNGNTCYFNSAIQLLLRIHELSSHILKTEYTGDCDFTNKYKELVKIYFQNEKDKYQMLAAKIVIMIIVKMMIMITLTISAA